MSWILLVIAGLCEVVWAVGLRYTAGFTRLWPSAIVLVFMIASFVLLARATKTIPPAVAYSVWVGVGIVGTWGLSLLLLKDPFKPVQLVFVAMVAVGLVGLKLTTDVKLPSAGEGGESPKAVPGIST